MAATNGGRTNGMAPAVAALLVIMSGMYAMTRPMDQRMSQLETQHEKMRGLSERNQDKVSSQVKGITKAETELKEINIRVHELEEWQVYWTRDMLPTVVQIQEKVKTLERTVAGGANPQISGE